MTRGLTGRSIIPSRARFSISAWKLSDSVRVELRRRPSHMNPAENCRSISAVGRTAKPKRRSEEAPKTKTAMSWARVRHWRRSSLRRAWIMGGLRRGQGTGDGGQMGFWRLRVPRLDNHLSPVPYPLSPASQQRPLRGDDSSRLQRDRAIGITRHPLDLVRGDQHCRAARLELLHDGVDEPEALGIELSVRLVEEDNVGLLQQDARE